MHLLWRLVEVRLASFHSADWLRGACRRSIRSGIAQPRPSDCDACVEPHQQVAVGVGRDMRSSTRCCRGSSAPAQATTPPRCEWGFMLTSASPILDAASLQSTRAASSAHLRLHPLTQYLSEPPVPVTGPCAQLSLYCLLHVAWLPAHTASRLSGPQPSSAWSCCYSVSNHP